MGSEMCIRDRCSYAVKYHSIGVLNTDWGDFLHVNHPEFGVVGMIYGAAFSWNGNIPSFDEIETFILENCMNGDLLITMGAGDVVNIGEHLLGK